MRSLCKKVFTCLVIAAMFSCAMPSGGKKTEAAAQDSTRVTTVNVAPSKMPPGGLAVHEAPMFVSIGFDDGMYSGLQGSGGSGGMTWIADFVQNKTNHNSGTNNPALFDGAPVRFSFFMTTYYITTWSEAHYNKVAWKRMYDEGHEIGNHTVSHYNDTNRSFSLSKIQGEMQNCEDQLMKPFNPNETPNSPSNANGIGIPAGTVQGFRNPHLAYSDNTFTAIKNMGYTYDCSINEGFKWMEPGTNFTWPYTLDNGSPGNKVEHEWGEGCPLIGSHPGIWEMPAYVVVVPPDDKCEEYGVPVGLRDKLKRKVDYFSVEDGKITGLDYNMWVIYGLNKAEYLATLKYTLDLRLQGNRAPMLFGAHSGEYSTKWNAPGLNATAVERQQAMEEFINYALTKKAVRMVPFKDIITWLENPVPLPPGADITLNVTSGANGTVSPSGAVVVKEGRNQTFTLLPDKGYMVDQVLVGGKAVKVKDNQFTVSYIENPVDIAVSFKVIPQGTQFRMTFYWTYNFNEEPVSMDPPLVDMLTVTDEVLATVPIALAKRISMEGSGFLPDGRLLNLNNSFDWPESRFMLVDQNEAPWGFDSQGGALVPWKSIAVDSNVIPLNSEVYIKEFDGAVLPDGTVHNGWFVSVDTSHSFTGKHLDIFVATYQNYEYMSNLLGNIDHVELYSPEMLNPVFRKVTATSGPGGKISPEGVVEVTDNGFVYFGFYPDGANTVKEVTVDGIPVIPNANNEVRIENIVSDRTIHVEFNINGPVHRVTASAGTNGSVFPVSVDVPEGGSQVFTFTPAKNYIVDRVTLDGVDVTASVMNNSYEVANVMAAAALNVTFKVSPYPTHTLTGTAVLGTITPATVEVVEGNSQTFTFTPDDPSFVVESVVVDGVDVTASVTGNSYTFTNVVGPGNIVVTYKDPNPSKYTAVYTIGQDWGTGFGADVVITNTSSETLYNWQVVWTYSGDVRVTSLWNATFSQSGKTVTVTHPGWSPNLAPGASFSFGFNGVYNGANEVPADIVVK